MLAPQVRQADQTRIIESLARESEFPIDEVAHLYEEELAELGIGARITSFLPIFAIRNVQEALRKRGAAHCGGSRRWADRMGTLTRGLNTGRSVEVAEPPHSNDTTHYDARELEGLPAPVQRYFRAVLKEGQPIVSAVTIEMAGTINMSATAEQWKPFTSVQRVVTSSAGSGSGFIWDAKIVMLPGITVRVVDSYIAGRGLVRAAVLGLFTVADISGGDEMARGEFMRFFAETPWYPTALLPSQGVQWAEVDATSAKATLVDGSVTLTLLFHFSDAGLVDSVRAGARGGMVGKEMVTRPWECGLSNYQVRDGMTVPMSGEAAWVRPDGRKTYFMGAVKSIAYEYAG